MVNLSSVLVARSPTLDDRGQLTRYPTVHRSADYGYLLPSGVPCPTGRDDACRLAPSRDRRDGGRRGRRLGAARSNSARPPRRSYCPGVTPHWAASSSTQVVVAAAGWAGGVATTTNSVTPAPASSGVRRDCHRPAPRPRSARAGYGHAARTARPVPQPARRPLLRGG
jgi:hypothetical protein